MKLFTKKFSRELCIVKELDYLLFYLFWVLCFNVNLSVLPAMFKVVTRPVAPGGVNAQLGQIIRFSSFLPSLGRW